MTFRGTRYQGNRFSVEKFRDSSRQSKFGCSCLYEICWLGAVCFLTTRWEGSGVGRARGERGSGMCGRCEKALKRESSPIMYWGILVDFYYISAWFASVLCDRFNRNSSADVLQQLWCPAAIDNSSGSKAAAILCTRYEVSRSRYCYFPSLMLYTPHLQLLERGERQCLEKHSLS